MLLSGAPAAPATARQERSLSMQPGAGRGLQQVATRVLPRPQQRRGRLAVSAVAAVSCL